MFSREFRAADSAWVRELVPALGALTGPGGVVPDADSRELLGLLTELEQVKSAVAAAQVRVTAAFARAQEHAAQVARDAAKDQGFGAWQGARDAFRGSNGTAEQVGFARRLSPWQGARAVSTALVLTSGLPHTLAALQQGVLSEWRATLVVRETSHLSAEDRAAVDAQVCGNRGVLAGMRDKAVQRAVRAAGYDRDPAGAVRRARTAEGERHITSARCRM